MKPSVPMEWRPKQRWKRRFYAVYMRWLERVGYLIVFCVIGSFIFAFNYKVDELIKADGVTIEPVTTAVAAEDKVLVTRSFVQHGQDVAKGAKLFEIVVGESDIETHHLIRMLSGRNINSSALISRKPNSVVVTSPSAGVVIFEEGSSPEGKTLEKGQAIAKVANFSELRAEASLSGQSVAVAEVGNEAIISAVVVQPESSILFRGFSGKDTLVSGQLFHAEVTEQITKLLMGKVVAIPNDRSFEIKGVSDIQIDGSVQTVVSKSTEVAIVLEPKTSDVFIGKVVSGVHSAQYQLGALPAELKAKIETALRERATAKNLTGGGSEILSINGLDKLNIVVKGDSQSVAESVPAELRGVAVKRSFDGEIRLANPSPSLLQHVRMATLNGRKVTARIEVKTGNRPIAFTLLKKS